MNNRNSEWKQRGVSHIEFGMNTFFFIDNNVDNIVIGSYTLVEFTHIATMMYMTNIGGFE